MATTSKQIAKRPGAPAPKAPPAKAPNPKPGPVVSPQKKSAPNPFISPFTIFMYGIPGVGKSSMWAHLPNVMYVHDPQEEGILELVKFGQVPEPVEVQVVDNWQHLRNMAADIANKKYKGIQHVVFESVTGFEKFCFQDHCAREFDNDWSKEGFYSFYKGPKQAAKTDWPAFLDDLDEIRRSGIGVVLVGHSQVKNFENPNGPDYNRYIPFLDNETWAQTHRWAQTILFYDLYTEVQKSENKIKKGKAGNHRRIIYTTPIGPCIAKSWWGLEDVIDAGESPKEAYDNFVAAYQKAARRAKR
jgi:hypothetical protein